MFTLTAYGLDEAEREIQEARKRERQDMLSSLDNAPSSTCSATRCRNAIPPSEGRPAGSPTQHNTSGAGILTRHNAGSPPPRAVSTQQHPHIALHLSRSRWPPSCPWSRLLGIRRSIFPEYSLRPFSSSPGPGICLSPCNASSIHMGSFQPRLRLLGGNRTRTPKGSRPSKVTEVIVV